MLIESKKEEPVIVHFDETNPDHIGAMMTRFGVSSLSVRDDAEAKGQGTVWQWRFTKGGRDYGAAIDFVGSRADGSAAATAQLWISMATVILRDDHVVTECFDSRNLEHVQVLATRLGFEDVRIDTLKQTDASTLIGWRADWFEGQKFGADMEVPREDLDDESFTHRLIRARMMLSGLMWQTLATLFVTRYGQVQ